MDTQNEATSYLRACQAPFWQQVIAAELDYLRQRLRPGDEILSVGCGPALIERGLAEYGFAVTGLDVSPQAIALYGIQRVSTLTSLRSRSQPPSRLD